MPERRTFTTFEYATRFAGAAARRAGEGHLKEAVVTRVGEGFAVDLLTPIPFDKICSDYVYTPFRYGIEKLDYLVEIFTAGEREILASPALTWLDAESGLSWDMRRLLQGNAWGVSPSYPEVMNAVAYGGFSDWRLPTLDELTVMTPMKWAELGIELVGSAVWIAAPPGTPGDEHQFLRLHDLVIDRQRFIEQHRDRQTSGDGYTGEAMTVFVRSSATPSR